MRFRTTAFAVVFSCIGAFEAEADQHEMKVNEILLSNNGSTTSQFVEFEDPGEPFPNTYVIQVHDAAGTALESQPVVIPPGTTTRVTLATTQARTEFGIPLSSVGGTHVINLNVELPSSGSLCFRSMGTNIHCMSWGTLTGPAPSSPGGTVGPAPGNGMSLQRQANSCAAVGTPTPHATNATLACAPMVDGPPGSVVDAPPGSGPDGGGNMNNPDGDEGCGCAAGINARSVSWFALVFLVGIVLLRRRAVRRPSRQ